MYHDNVSDAYCRQLYEQFCRGERRAGIELVNLFGNRLLQYVRRSCIYSDQDAAEDCVQNTWMKLVQYCGKPLQAGTFWGFVCAIARHQAIDDYRSSTRQKRNPGEQVEYAEEYHQPDELADGEADPARVLELLESTRSEEQRLGAFKQAMTTLPDKQRLALSLQLAGYSLKDIASHMQEKEETVKSHLRYAKNKLKRLLVTGGEQAADMQEAWNP